MARTRRRGALGGSLAAALAAALLPFVAGGAAASTTQVRNPVADTFVSSGATTTAYGTAAQLQIDGSPTAQAFLRFDLRDVPVVVESATLRLRLAAASNAGSPSGGTLATSTNLSWPEATTTWNTRPSVNGAAITTIGTVSPDQWVAIDVTAQVAAGSLVTFALSSTNGDGAYYDSRESGADAPQLVLDLGDAPAPATTALVAVADTYTAGDATSSNFGTATDLQVDGSPIRESFLRFDRSSVPGTVRQARLRLRVADRADGGSSVGGTVARVTSTTWSETGTTYANRPARAGDLGPLGAVTRDGWVEMDVTSAVTSAPAGVSFGIRSTNGDGAYYDSRESGADAPQLVVVVTPPPPASAVLRPVADTYASADATSTNFGTAAELAVDGSPARETFLRFDRSATPGTILRATLRLRVADRADGRSPVGGIVARVGSTSWSETGLTWSNKPARGADAGHLGTVVQNGWVELDVTQAVASASGALSLSVRSSNGDGAYYDSRETGADAPQLALSVGAAPTPVTGITVAAVGDAACAPGQAVTSTTCRQLAVSNLVANDPAIARFLGLGDLQYESGALSAFQQAYDPTYGRFKAITVPVPGNHEYATAGAAGYFDYFGALAGDPTRGYYSLDIGDTWHVVALNSNCAIVSCAVGSAQHTWLAADLAASTRPCTIALWHHPRFSSGDEHGSDASVAPLWQALDVDHAELVLQGHEHDYERFAPMNADGIPTTGGVRSFVVGTGGRSLRSFAAAVLGSESRQSTFGVLALTLGADRYAWRFVDQTGAVRDSGVGACTP